MARRYSRISPLFWDEVAMKGWTDDQRLLGIYLLTCSHHRTEGLFRLPTAYVESDLGWPGERVEATLRALIAESFCSYDFERSVVLLKDAFRHQSLENANQVTAAVNAIEGLPDTPLLGELLTIAESDCPKLAEGLRASSKIADNGFRKSGKGFPENVGERYAEGFGHPPTPTPALTQSPTPTPSFSSEVRRKLFDRMQETVRNPDEEETNQVLDLLLEHVDPRLIDECIGFASKKPPRRPVYFLEAVPDRAKTKGVRVPPLRLSDHPARAAS